MERAKVTLQDIYNEIGKYLNEKGNKEVLSIATHCNASDNTLFSFNLGELDTDTMTETDTIRVKKSLETKDYLKASNDPSFKKGDYVFMTEQADNCNFQIGKIIGEIWGSKPNSSYFMVVFNDGRVEEIPMDKMNEAARVIGKTDSDNVTSNMKTYGCTASGYKKIINLTREEIINTLVINHMEDRSILEEMSDKELMKTMDYYHEEY